MLVYSCTQKALRQQSQIFKAVHEEFTEPKADWNVASVQERFKKPKQCSIMCVHSAGSPVISFRGVGQAAMLVYSTGNISRTNIYCHCYVMYFPKETCNFFFQSPCKSETFTEIKTAKQQLQNMLCIYMQGFTLYWPWPNTVTTEMFILMQCWCLSVY